MRVTATPDEQVLISRVLAFANMKRINSASEVESLFSSLSFTGWYDEKRQRRFQVIKKGGVQAYRSDQTVLKGALAEIVGGKAENVAEVTKRVRSVLERLPVLLVPTVEGKPRQILLFAGVEACVHYALLLLLDASRGMGDRLGQCDAPGCEKFNLAFEGRPRRYCNDEHRLKADTKDKKRERMKQWRKGKAGGR